MLETKSQETQKLPQGVFQKPCPSHLATGKVGAVNEEIATKEKAGACGFTHFSSLQHYHQSAPATQQHLGQDSFTPGQVTLVTSGIKNSARFTDHVSCVGNWWTPPVEDSRKQSHCYFPLTGRESCCSLAAAAGRTPKQETNSRHSLKTREPLT